MKRLIALPSLLLLVALAGCGSTSSPTTSSAPPPSQTAAASPTEAAATPMATASASAPMPAPVAGGTATDFCGAFKEIQAVSETPTGDVASMGAQFRAAAADMRKFAPADIQKAANTYADVMDTIGKAAEGGTIDQAALSKAISDGMAGNSSDISTTAVWVAKNCAL